jgi:hypothetical protein
MLASQLEVGQFIPSLGRIDGLTINLGDKAILRPTFGWGFQIRRGVRLNGLLYVRLAQEALEHSYERVPVSVTVISSSERRTFDIGEEVEVEEEMLAAA